ncbi:hypothetical protein Bca101_072005 [Brassica carinata]
MEPNPDALLSVTLSVTEALESATEPPPAALFAAVKDSDSSVTVPEAAETEPGVEKPSLSYSTFTLVSPSYDQSSSDSSSSLSSSSSGESPVLYCQAIAVYLPTQYGYWQSVHCRTYVATMENHGKLVKQGVTMIDDGIHFRQPWAFGVEDEVRRLRMEVNDMAEEIAKLKRIITSTSRP